MPRALAPLFWHLEPLPIHEPGETLRGVVQPLRSGTPIAVIDGAGWRLLRPVDALSFPLSRQLCDLPGEPLATLAVDQDVDLEQLGEREIWGATKNHELVGRVDSLRVLASVADLPGADTDGLLAIAARERLLPKLLHDLSNALNIAAATQRQGADPAFQLAGAEAIDHAAALVVHMRELYSSGGERVVGALDLAAFFAAVEPMLHVAAAPAALEVLCGRELEVFGERWRLESALLNAVLNASEHAKRIVIDARAAGGHWVSIVVADDGPGFPELDTPGRQLEAIRGHGLASIQRQVLAMGGRFKLGRSSTGGARIEICLVHNC